MLSKTLSGLILVLTILSGVVILSSVPKFEGEEAPRPSQKVAEERRRLTSLPSGILSRFSLFPNSLKKPIPLAVMIENHEHARPYHIGIDQALVIQEFLVEGFISRFVAIIDARNLPKEIGPVRSLRPYFLDAIKPWSRTVFHAGGSPEALKRVQEGSEFYALNLLYFDDKNGEYGSFRKDGPPAPHDLFLKKKVFKSFLEEVPERLLQQVSWPPYTIGIPDGGENASDIRVNFFNALHNVSFEYLPLAQKYQRTNGGEVSPARPNTIAIMEVPIDYIGEYGRLFMTLEGSGNVQIFHSGKVWEGRWSRGVDTQKFTFTNADGEEIPFKAGQLWMMVLPTLE
ncbi:MAG: DUF3048 domain-containing protein, partial [Candidatus Peribacter sp.]|nr:DUF3048 domain-containing protein [Candidatus Peribacter sp.]MBT5937611.1 DUF3048 domain-containing protein [Candidatus Peribacter sp.]MBT7493694.1 DUF3048 domain-containing protein [Candidatus Peribacter sp.]